MKIILVAMLSLLALSACGPVYQTQYEIVPPQGNSARMCANNCLLSKTNCRQSCQIQNNQCEEIERLRAQSDYLSYLNQQNREGRPAKKSERDFYSGYQCSNDSCEENCDQDFQICHTNCGGQIIPHTICTAFCN
jgi:hypothetical protein